MMRDERGELRGLLLALGVTVALAAVVFGLGLRSRHGDVPTAAKVAAGVTTAADPLAPSTTAAPTAAPADPAASDPAAPAGSSSAPAPASAPSAGSAPRTAAPPVTTAPVIAPPATSPPATSPPATAPPTTMPRTCTVTMGNATPKRGTALEITVASNSPRSSVSGSITPTSGVGQSYGLVGTTDENGSVVFTHQATPSDQPAGTTYKVAVTVGPTKAACSTTFTTS